jgi:hypothetical protein
MCSACPDPRRPLALAAAFLLVLAACEREKRQFESWPPSASASTAVREVQLQPGPAPPALVVPGPNPNKP